MKVWRSPWLNRLRYIYRRYCHDLPVALWHIYLRGHLLKQPHAWLKIKNRGEKVTLNSTHTAVRCDFALGSYLHISQATPKLAHQLMQQTLEQWPIQLDRTTPATHTSKISVIIPFKGKARLPQLQLTLHSWLAQTVPVECLVIEHSEQAIVKQQLPTGVKHWHLPHPTRPEEWNKCWAMNVGAQHASGDILVFHDADILCPSHYAQALVDAFTEGADAAALHRMLFYLTAEDSHAIAQTHSLENTHSPYAIQHNFQGGTLAIKRDKFHEIGGFDEGFTGWGGEDNEFFDRCKMLNFERFGYLPFVHLWHAPQTGRQNNQASHRILAQRLAIPRQQRAAELRARHHDTPPSSPPVQPYRLTCKP